VHYDQKIYVRSIYSVCRCVLIIEKKIKRSYEEYNHDQIHDKYESNQEKEYT
jgi:hypothetical protein